MTQTWPRPVPLIGDATSAAERREDPAGWSFPEEAVEQLAQIIAARRDIRRFRPDPVPAELVTRVLTAAHQAPSVGHSQPWRFIVVTDPVLRERAATMADTERIKQAAQLAPEAARRLLDLQLEGIREAPLGIVVCCDRRTKAQGVLGRATFTDSDMWSCAAAIQNAWLTARSLGLGLGWVTLFDQETLASLIDLPKGVETLGWLCLGWPDERPPVPGLERAAWSSRQPLDDVMFQNRWPGDRDPKQPPSALRAPDQEHVVAPKDDADQLLTPGESLGVLDRAVNRVLALRNPAPTTGTLVLAAADHPVARHRVSAYDQSVTRNVFEATKNGTSLGATTAAAAGLSVTPVDAGIGATEGRGDLATTDAMSRQEASRWLDRGRELGGELASRGLVVLGEVGVANTTVAATLAACLLNETAATTVGLGAGSDSAMLERKHDVVTRALARVHPATPLEIIAAFGGPDVAVLTGVTLGAAEAGAAVILDGLLTSVAALLAVRLEPGVTASLTAGQRSRERAHPLVLQQLGLEPLLDLRTRAGEGVGGCLAAQLLLSGLQIRKDAARTEHPVRQGRL